MALDKSTLQIFANYCVAAAESMAFTLMRTAHSTFVKETQDFSCTLLTPEGKAFASPSTLGATWYVGIDYGPAIASIDHYDPDDIGMTNDTYSGFVATHSPDMMMWKPIFHDGEIVCYVAGHIHNTDIGGAVPASLSRSLTEIHQEGIRIPPNKIIKQGVLNEDLISIMNINVRAPEQNLGDLHAQLAMMDTGEQRVREIIERFGVDDFRQGVCTLLDHAELQSRHILEGIPDGNYFFAEYADEDSVNGKPMRVALEVRIQGDEAILDYTGSDPQLLSSLNMPTGGMPRHALALVGFHYVLYTLDPTIFLNAGLYRCVHCILPEGSVVNPVAPAAVGMRSLTCKIAHMLTFGAFFQAIPDRLPACAAGGMAIMNVKTMDHEGKTIMASIGPVGGGAGGMPHGDGEEGSGANVAFLSNTPVEINEAEVPIRITRYCLTPDSGGAGKYRGGLGLTMEFKVFAPGTIVTARNRDRTYFSSWGVLGGKAGANARFIRNPDSTQPEALGNSDIVHCQPGDVIRLSGTGGGGYGMPWERDMQSVLRDVRSGYISVQSAAQDYGVIIHEGETDLIATQEARARLMTQDVELINHGSYRVAFERVWTRERYKRLTDILAGLPINWRFFVKHKMFDGMNDLEQKGEIPDGMDVIDQLYDDLCNNVPDLARLQHVHSP